MKKNRFFTLAIALSFLFCATVTQANDQYVDNRPVVQPYPAQPAPPVESNISEKDLKDAVISKKNAKLNAKEKRAVSLAKGWMNKKIMPILRHEDGSVSYAYGSTMPTLICSPFKVSVIQLGPDEKIVDQPSCGDNAQWGIAPSANPVEGRPPHIFVKPFDSNLSTNLAIMTDKRTYIINLKSRNDKYTPMISFRYPEEDRKAWEKYLAEQEEIEKSKQRKQMITSSAGLEFDAENLDFEYTIEGKASWKPVRVFNDGKKTYIQMPKKMKFSSAPVLLTINKGEQAIVNYRLKRELFIVDQLFSSAVLISGVGEKQTRIEIEHITK